MNAQRKAPAGTGAIQNNITETHCTSLRGRRAISHLWTASRAVAGAELTADDHALIREALSEIAEALS